MYLLRHNLCERRAINPLCPCIFVLRVSDFESVMSRFQARQTDKITQLTGTLPAYYAFFDILIYKGKDTEFVHLSPDQIWHASKPSIYRVYRISTNRPFRHKLDRLFYVCSESKSLRDKRGNSYFLTTPSL